MNHVRQKPIRIGIVGLGKIARDQHLPAIAENDSFEIAFLADKAVRSGEAAPHFDSLDQALHSEIPFDAISLCTSPQPRLELCERLLGRNCAILLEKPSAATYEQASSILRKADLSQTLVFAAWHSKFAPKIDDARAWLETRKLAKGHVVWRENAAKWHPGQDWLWRHGGFGVFDPGMNALSILTTIFTRHKLVVDSGRLKIPENSATPSAAQFQLNAKGAPISAEFEFHDRDDETWNIDLLATDGSRMILSEGGAAVRIDDGETHRSDSGEYRAMYQHFEKLIHSNRTDFDMEPLRIIDQISAISEIEAVEALPKILFEPSSA